MHFTFPEIIGCPSAAAHACPLRCRTWGPGLPGSLLRRDTAWGSPTQSAMNSAPNAMGCGIGIPTTQPFAVLVGDALSDIPLCVTFCTTGPPVLASNPSVRSLDFSYPSDLTNITWAGAARPTCSWHRTLDLRLHLIWLSQPLSRRRPSARHRGKPWLRQLLMREQRWRTSRQRSCAAHSASTLPLWSQRPRVLGNLTLQLS